MRERVEKDKFSPSGDFPLPLALRKVEEWEGERIERVFNVYEQLNKIGIPQNLIFLAVPFISILAGLPLNKIKGVRELIEGILISRETKSPSNSQRKKEEFLNKVRNR